MNKLIEALQKAGITLTEDAVSAELQRLGITEDDLTPQVIDSIVKSFGAGALTTAQKGGKATRKSRAKTPQASREDLPVNALASALKAVHAEQQAMVGGFVEGIEQQASHGAQAMLDAATGLTPLTLALLTQGLTDAQQNGVFDPARFRGLGQSLAAATELPGDAA